MREHLKEHIDAKWDDEEFKGDFKKLKEQVRSKLDNIYPSSLNY